MSGHKKRRSSKKRSAGRVRDRLNIETDPAELYPLMRKEEMDPEKDEGDSFPDDSVIDLLPEETAAGRTGIFAEETVTDYLPEKIRN